MERPNRVKIAKDFEDKNLITYGSHIEREYHKQLKLYVEYLEKQLTLADVSEAEHPLPRPLECWNKARELDCGDYIEWHLEKERGNAR